MRRSDAGIVEFYTKDARVARMTPYILHPLPPSATEAIIARALYSEREEDIWVIDGTRSTVRSHWACQVATSVESPE